MSFAGPVPGVLGAVIQDATDLPEHLPDAKQVDSWTEALPGALLMSIPGIARFLVQKGSVIAVEPVSGADPASVELFLNGTVRGALIHQRGELPLNGACLTMPNGRAVALCGPSGFGKSTLAAELCRRGWSLIADDITRISWTRGQPLAWPTHDSVKLWRDACASMEIDCENLPATRTGLGKYYVKVRPASAPAVLKTIIQLKREDTLSVEVVTGSRKATIVRDCVFRPRQVETLARRVDHDQMIEQIARTCGVIVLSGAREHPNSVLADQIMRVAQ